MTLTRADIAQHVGNAFIGGGATRRDLLWLARASRAPGDVVELLRGLPEQRFGRLCELWELLPEVPPPAPDRSWSLPSPRPSPSWLQAA